MENIKEINVAEIFVAAVDDIDPEAMFDLRGRDLSDSATGQSPTSTDPANWKAPKTTAPATSAPSSETLVSVFCPSGGALQGAKCGTSPTIGLCLKQ